MKRIKLETGKRYTNRNGSTYICKFGNENSAILERESDGWTLTAWGIGLHEDGTIEWDYSTRGHWKRSESA